MWLISQNNLVLTNGNILFLASSYFFEGNKDIYSIEFRNIDSEETIKLAEYDTLEDCKIVLCLIKDAIKNSLFDFKLPTKEKLEKVKNDKNNKGTK